MPPSQPIPITGYADRFSAQSGQAIDFKVSSHSSAAYEARLVRVHSCDPNPQGPGVVEEAVESNLASSYPSRVQAVRLGSHMTVDMGEHLTGLKSFTVTALVFPTLTAAGLQGVFSTLDGNESSGFALAVSPEGAVAIAGGERLCTEKPLVDRRWYRLWLTYDAGSRTISVGQAPLHPAFDADDAASATHEVANPPAASSPSLVTVAALHAGLTGGHFNGKIEAPAVLADAVDGSVLAAGPGSPAGGVVAAWDFGQAIGTPTVKDTGPHGLDGLLVNLPTRAVTGACWDGSAMDWTQRPEHYAAIHFHDDDLYDCEWETDFTLDLPADLPSGVYAVRLRTAEGDEDAIPFFVTPRIGTPTARLAVLIPTFTYTVYANIARGNSDDSKRRQIEAWGAYPFDTDTHSEYGLSTYNRHSDGTGIAYSSRHRPIITMRPGVICYPDVPGSGLRHFAADAHLWYWLKHSGYDYDVITDDDLHEHGLAALEGYSAVMTTTHPEYHSPRSLDALSDYTGNGGRLLYLGGNGFYWKVALSDAWPGAVEIRRGEGGIRAWAAQPGEYYNAFDGTYGGLWRRNGRPPQQLCGVGFTSQGEHRGEPYRRTAASYDPDHAWIFAGIEDEVIGDFGLAGGGAAGFELDRADHRLGTPLNAVVLASSPGAGDHFVLVPEEILTHKESWNGESFESLVRADIVYFETGKGGAVFSTGSITFCGSLPWNDCDNNVSRMLRNVLDRFLA